MKMLIAADSDDILGFTAPGLEASELAAAVRLATGPTQSRHRLAQRYLPPPTTAEGLTILIQAAPRIATADTEGHVFYLPRASRDWAASEPPDISPTPRACQGNQLMAPQRQ
jgi:hypothetical protein